MVNFIFLAIFAAILILMADKIYAYMQTVDLSEIRFNYIYLTASFLMIPLWFTLMCHTWRRMLRNMGENISLLDSMRVIGLSMFGKYIPGKVWFTVGRTLLAQRLGVRKSSAFTAVILETVYMIFTGTWFLIFLVLRIQMDNLQAIMIFAAAVILMFPLALPAVSGRMINFLLVKLKKERIHFDTGIAFVIELLILYFAVWLIQGIQYTLLIKSFIPQALDVVKLAAVYPGAWVIGFVALVMPAGIGMRDGFIVIVMTKILGDNSGLAVAAAVLSRAQITIGELLYTLLLIGSGRLWRKNEENKQN